MNAFIAKSLRPLQCAHAMLGGGFLARPWGVIFGAAERLTRAAILLAGGLRLRGASWPSRTIPGTEGDDDADVDTPRVSHVEPVMSPFRNDARNDVVDEASWESFPRERSARLLTEPPERALSASRIRRARGR